MAKKKECRHSMSILSREAEAWIIEGLHRACNDEQYMKPENRAVALDFLVAQMRRRWVSACECDDCEADRVFSGLSGDKRGREDL